MPKVETIDNMFRCILFGN